MHGDLSEFNVLLGTERPVIIDLPQAVATLLISDETMEQALKIITTKVVERKTGEAVVLMGHGTVSSRMPCTVP